MDIQLRVSIDKKFKLGNWTHVIAHRLLDHYAHGELITIKNFVIDTIKIGNKVVFLVISSSATEKILS